jgi:hypothetical protein
MRFFGIPEIIIHHNVTIFTNHTKYYLGAKAVRKVLIAICVEQEKFNCFFLIGLLKFSEEFEKWDNYRGLK